MRRGAAEGVEGRDPAGRSGRCRSTLRTQRRSGRVTGGADPRIETAWAAQAPNVDHARLLARARCGKAARRDLRGRCRETGPSTRQPRNTNCTPGADAFRVMSCRVSRVSVPAGRGAGGLAEVEGRVETFGVVDDQKGGADRAWVVGMRVCVEGGDVAKPVPARLPVFREDRFELDRDLNDDGRTFGERCPIPGRLRHVRGSVDRDVDRPVFVGDFSW